MHYRQQHSIQHKDIEDGKNQLSTILLSSRI